MLVGVLSLSSVALAKKPNNGQGHTPVTICHHAGPNPANWHTITVDDDSVTLKAHLGHGDTLGACPVVEEPPVTEPPVDEPPVVTVPEVPVVPEQPNEVTPPADEPKPDPAPVKKDKKQAVDNPVVNSNPTPSGVQVTPVTTKDTGVLPYTGVDAWLLFLIGLGLATAGYFLYTRNAKQS